MQCVGAHFMHRECWPADDVDLSSADDYMPCEAFSTWASVKFLKFLFHVLGVAVLSMLQVAALFLQKLFCLAKV